MSLKMRQVQDSERSKTTWVGPSSPEQKPTLCSKCGKPVARAYRVYEQKTDQWGNKRITKGQYEVAHVVEGRPVWDACPYPSLLEQLQEKVRKDKEEEEEANPEKRMIHWTRASDGPMLIWCGAKGDLWISDVRAEANCINCIQRWKQNEIISQHQGDSNNKGDQDMAMTREQIQEKIQKAKAAKANGGGQQGQSANLVSGAIDDDGVPMPKATVTGTRKQKVGNNSSSSKGSSKADGPKVLNLCGDGCGAGCKSRFIPGHDARLHSMIKRMAAGKMKASELPEQVREGMYKGVKQVEVKGVVQGVQPTKAEALYLETLKGAGGPA